MMQRAARGGAAPPPLDAMVAHASAPRRRRQDDLQTAAFIAQAVAFSTGVGAGAIADPGRNGAAAARARQIAMYLAHTALSWPLWRVGLAFGRDRTTAGHACAVIERLRDDKLFDARLEDLEMCLKAAPVACALPLIL